MFTITDMKNEARTDIINALHDGFNSPLSELHNEVFNMETYTNDTGEVFKLLDELGGYTVVSECIKYEQDNFGCVSAERYSNPVWVLSMYWYIIGEEVLCDLMDGVEECDVFWNEDMTDEESVMLASRFEEKEAY